MARRRTSQLRCSRCRKSVPEYDIVNVVSFEAPPRRLCTSCHNSEVAAAEGVAYEHPTFEPMSFTDAEGRAHLFHFRPSLIPDGRRSLESFEVSGGRRAGYEFQVTGDPDCDFLVLLARLIEKVRRRLSIAHIRVGNLGYEIADERVVRGHIGYDAETEGPMLVIDGKEISWDEFGRMLLTFEGFAFKLEIHDVDEEL